MANQRVTDTADVRVTDTGDVRIRADRLFLEPSANIGAGGADATTARLTAPAGKSSGADFQAGKISDDTNPLASMDVGSGKYTELEWCFAANDTTALPGDVYEFRVTMGGVALDTYTVTPQVTIAASGRPAWQHVTRVDRRAQVAARW